MLNVDRLDGVRPALVELDFAKESIEVDIGERPANLLRRGGPGPFDGHLEGEAGSGGRAGVLVGQVSEARRVGQRVVKAIQKVARTVASGRRPLGCADGVVR